MARSLLDDFQSLLTPDLLSRTGSALGESSDGVSRALKSAVPALLAAAVAKGREGGGTQQLLALLNDPALDTRTLSDPGSLVSAALPGGTGSSIGNLASRFLSVLLGDRADTIANALAQSAGIPRSTTQAILPVAASLVMGLLGSKVRTERLGTSGLAGMLENESGSIRSALPSGLGSLLDLSGLRDAGAGAAGAVRAGAEKGRSLLWPIAIAVAVLLGLWALLNRGGPPTPTATLPPVAAAPPAVSSPAPAAAAQFERTLPSGYALRAPKSGVESLLVVFIEDSGRPVDDTTWFDFDRLLFQTGSATLEPQSREQLRNVAEILKAYPAVNVKIGGYTDNTGDPAANLKLSQDRAASVVTELIALGVAPDRLSAEGYGQAHPIADNATGSGRGKNRRIALRVTEK
jgi:outer membrane protein OmpA-like peptidoglycan-associated protein